MLCRPPLFRIIVYLSAQAARPPRNLFRTCHRHPGLSFPGSSCLLYWCFVGIMAYVALLTLFLGQSLVSGSKIITSAVPNWSNAMSRRMTRTRRPAIDDEWPTMIAIDHSRPCWPCHDFEENIQGQWGGAMRRHLMGIFLTASGGLMGKDMD